MQSLTSPLAVVLYLSLVFGKEITDIDILQSKPTRCTYEYAYDMYGAHCGGLHLERIPSLKSGIEILDFSDNKLQEVTYDTFSSYTSIKFLYLAENQIYHIDEDAFSALTSLDTLDLSKNVIFDLPTSIFQLPSLRKLYLSHNPVLHRSLNGMEIAQPIRAPLELLDLSDCKITKLPSLGLLPQLVFYNISHNPLMSIEAKHFARMCSLGKVDLTNSIDKIPLCSMRSTILWFQEKRIYFQLDDYSKLNSKEFELCPTTEESRNVLNSTFHRCKSEFLQVQNVRSSRKTWLTISGGLAGFLVGFMLLLYIMHRRNVAQTKTEAEKIKKAIPATCDKHASAILLNDVS